MANNKCLRPLSVTKLVLLVELSEKPGSYTSDASYILRLSLKEEWNLGAVN